MIKGDALKGFFSINDSQPKSFDIVESDFYAAEANVILENIVIYPKDIPLPETHLAPPESYRV
jgi:hypothetical protein